MTQPQKRPPTKQQRRAMERRDSFERMVKALPANKQPAYRKPGSNNYRNA